jgi:hypothetical protein
MRLEECFENTKVFGFAPETVKAKDGVFSRAQSEVLYANVLVCEKLSHVLGSGMHGPIAYERFSMRCHYAFRMELHPPNVECSVPERHYFSSFIGGQYL